MIPYRTPVDVANEALQHCGASRMDATLGFNEGGVNATETSFAYDKQRQGELAERYWTFAIRHAVLRPRDANMMMLAPAMWSPITTYFIGSVVADQSGNFWISNIPRNLNNDPLLTTFWEPYCGPLGVPLYAATTSYYSGELVYKTPGDGTYKVYQSTVDGNSDDPATASAWDATVTYSTDQIVTRLSVAYKSLINVNTNQDPASAPALWAAGTTYAAGARVGGSDGIIYTSVGSGNVGHDPTLDTGTNWTSTGTPNPWTTVIGAGGTGSVKWLEIGGADFPAGVALTTINTRYPVGAGPSGNTSGRNVFVLPANYLRRAAQMPKPGVPVLGGPSGIGFDDWLIEKPFLISSDSLIVLRFVADITDVSRMDTLFCQVVATRIAFAVVDKVTQSLTRKELVAKIYKEWKASAHTIDGVEAGPTDQPDDEWITVRY